MRRLRHESEDLQEESPFAYGRKACMTRENGCGDENRRSRSFLGSVRPPRIWPAVEGTAESAAPPSSGPFSCSQIAVN